MAAGSCGRGPSSNRSVPEIRCASSRVAHHPPRPLLNPTTARRQSPLARTRPRAAAGPWSAAPRGGRARRCGPCARASQRWRCSRACGRVPAPCRSRPECRPWETRSPCAPRPPTCASERARVGTARGDRLQWRANTQRARCRGAREDALASGVCRRQKPPRRGTRGARGHTGYPVAGAAHRTQIVSPHASMVSAAGWWSTGRRQAAPEAAMSATRPRRAQQAAKQRPCERAVAQRARAALEPLGARGRVNGRCARGLRLRQLHNSLAEPERSSPPQQQPRRRAPTRALSHSPATDPPGIPAVARRAPRRSPRPRLQPS